MFPIYFPCPCYSGKQYRDCHGKVEDEEPDTLRPPPGPANAIGEKLTNQRNDGMRCYRCNDFCYMASPNTKKGKFECFECRSDAFRPGTKKRDDD